MTERCKEQVWSSAWYSHQCGNKAVKDGYCNLHHPEKVAQRREKARIRQEERDAKNPYLRAIKDVKRMRGGIKQLIEKYTLLHPSGSVVDDLEKLLKD